MQGDEGSNPVGVDEVEGEGVVVLQNISMIMKTE